MGIVVDEREILELEAINRVWGRGDLHGRQGAGVPGAAVAGFLAPGSAPSATIGCLGCPRQENCLGRFRTSSR